MGLRQQDHTDGGGRIQPMDMQELHQDGKPNHKTPWIRMAEDNDQPQSLRQVQRLGGKKLPTIMEDQDSPTIHPKA